MGGILDKLDEWLRGLLIEGITGNLSGMFDTVNTKVGEIAGEVGQTPLAWNSGVFSMIRNLSETVIVPIAGVILTFVMCYELIQLVTEKNNLHDVDTWMFFKWIKYGKVCHNLSYHIVGSRQDAEECVNDAYLGAWNAIPPARPNPLLSYLVKIVRNISLKIYWRKEAAKRSSHYTIALEEIEACIAAPNTVEAEIEAKELARIIEAFLDTLTTENRVIFMRRYWFSDSYKDIAEFMGLSEKNISVRLTRIREKMKQYLIEREVFV